MASRWPRGCCSAPRNIPRRRFSPRRCARAERTSSRCRCAAKPRGFREGQDFWRLIRELGVRVLPNTAGCHTVKEAVTTAQMAREIFGTQWIKLEVIGEADTLQPDVFGLVEAARILSEDGFEVFPYTTEDLVVAERLVEAGCKVLMPWGAPIGSGKGLNNLFGLRALRAHFPEIPLDRRRRHRSAARTPRRRWSLATTRCCSTPRWPRPAIPSRWRRRSPGRSRRGGGLSRGPDAAARHGGALDAGARAGRSSRERPRSVLSHRRQRGLGRAARRRRGAADPIAHQGSPETRNCAARRARRLRSAARRRAQLVVNDYWRIAIEQARTYVHLGQGDLDGADMKAIRSAGMRVGISTHDEAELERALALAPDYVALGPIYPTILKAMAFAPQGLERIGEWKRRIGDDPLVAIGGLNVGARQGVPRRRRRYRRRRHRHHAERQSGGANPRMDRGDARAVNRRSRSPLPARIRAAEREFRPISRPLPRSAFTAPARSRR